MINIAPCGESTRQLQRSQETLRNVVFVTNDLAVYQEYFYLTIESDEALRLAALRRWVTLITQMCGDIDNLETGV
jgi:hypothetical protein